MAGELVKTKSKMATFRETLEQMRPQIEMAMPRHLEEGRMARMVMTVVKNNPGLLDCTTKSLFGAIMASAQLGLYPDVSVLGHAYFIPFKVKGVLTVVFVPGYKGLIDLARRSGHVTSIMAYTVREGDSFEYEYGLAPFLKHRPSDVPIEGRDMTHVYAIARLIAEKIPQFIVMSRDEVEQIRKMSRSGQRGPWVDHYEAMSMKTSIRRLTKYLPLSSDLQRAVTYDELAESGIDQSLEDVIDTTAIEIGEDGEIIPTTDTVEVGEESDPLDDLTSGFTEDGSPNEFDRLWMQGNEKYGDEEWSKKVKAIKKTVKAKENEAMDPQQKAQALTLMLDAISG
jgi:recombination protein RecT